MKYLLWICIYIFLIELCTSNSVESPPLIAKFPGLDSDNTIIIGESFRNNRLLFDCSARGVPSPQITWYKDEVKLENEYPGISLKLGSLEINSPKLFEHGGRYHCEAVNSLGKARSDIIILTNSSSIPDWATPPTFDRQPEVEVIEIGKKAEFQCSAKTGNPEPNVIWTKNGILIENISNPNVLSIENVGPSDVGTYACNISNLAGYVYKMVYLNTLTQSPFIVEGPQNKTISTNQDSILRCRAKGYPMPNVTWFFEGKQMDSNTNEGGDLLLKNAVVENEGLYLCRATNVHGEDSSSAYLTVVEQTTITEGPYDTDVEIGQNITMNCIVVWNPNLELSVSWKKDNLNIDTSNERIFVSSNNDLTITNVIFSDSGIYTCVAMTSTGSSTDSGTLTVVGIPPTLISGPTDLTTTEGDTITIFCTVTGLPKPRHVWYGDTERLDFESLNRFSMDEFGNLRISNVNATDSKKYICRAENGYGEPVVSSAFIDIRKKTILLEGPKDSQYTSGETVLLDCLVETDSKLQNSLEVQWYKDESIVEENNRIIIFPNNSLMISDMVDEDIGEYKCTINTGIDEVIGKALIYSSPDYSWLFFVLILLFILFILLLLLCLIFFCTRRKKRKGRYGVKDIQEGSKKKGKASSEICYNIDDETESLNKDELLSDSNTSIIQSKSNYGKGNDSLDSLLNLTEEELWLKRGMEEDGSFIEGKYGTKE